MAKDKEKISVEEIVSRCGGQEKAGTFVGVSFTTISRWLNGHEKPKGLSLRRLKELGVDRVLDKDPASW